MWVIVWYVSQLFFAVFCKVIGGKSRKECERGRGKVEKGLKWKYTDIEVDT